MEGSQQGRLSPTGPSSRFPSTQSLKDYLTQIIENEGGSPKTKSSISGVGIPGFVSLADRIINERERTKAMEQEEMSIDEFRVYRAEELLLDPVLAHVVDTSLVIGVENKIYKITESGTFAIQTNRSIEDLRDAIESFDESNIFSLGNGEYLQIDDDITFINTFGNNSVSNEYFNISVNVNNESPNENDNTLVNNLHEGYNTTLYQWKNSSLWQKMWDALRGKDVTREVNIDDTHRVQVSIFDVNYAFYASSGITVKLQKQKRFLGIRYWVKDEAEKIAIGFNYLYGKYTLQDPMNYSALSPTNFATFSAFTSTISSKAYTFWYGKYSQIPYLRDWINQMVLFIPDVKIMGQNVTNQDILNELYDTPAKLTFNFLKNQVLRVYDPKSGVEKIMGKKDPRMAYLVWGKTVKKYEKDKSFITGVKEYSNIASKTVRFDFSIGFYWNNGLNFPIPMQISSFNIESVDAFGAVYYNGSWKGVRFVD